MLSPLSSSGRRPQILTIGTAVIASLTALALVWPVARLPIDYPIDINEGWNALNAARAMGGGALYPSANEFFFNNYPPLSFYIVGFVGKLLGDALIAGRLVSLLSMFAIAINIGLIVRNLGGGRSCRRSWLASFSSALCARNFSATPGWTIPSCLARR